MFECFFLSVGVSTYLCLAPDGIWDPQGPDLSNCSSPWVNHITQKVNTEQEEDLAGSVSRLLMTIAESQIRCL